MNCTKQYVDIVLVEGCFKSCHLCLTKYHVMKTYPVLNLNTTPLKLIGGVEV